MIWHAHRREWSWIKYAAIIWNEFWNLKTSFEIQYSCGSKVDTLISSELIGFLCLRRWRSVVGHDMRTVEIDFDPRLFSVQFLYHEHVHTEGHLHSNDSLTVNSSGICTYVQLLINWLRTTEAIK